MDTGIQHDEAIQLDKKKTKINNNNSKQQITNQKIQTRSIENVNICAHFIVH